MNTINDMAQLIMACKFDARHYIEHQRINYPKQVLLVKHNAPNNSDITICLTYSTMSDTVIQINAIIENEVITESMVLESETDLKQGVRLLELLDYQHSFECTVTTTLLQLVERDLIKIDEPLAVVEYNNKKYIGLVFGIVEKQRDIQTAFNLYIDPSFIYRLFIDPDGLDSIDVRITDRFKHTNVIEDITPKQLTAHLEWAEDKIVDFLHSMPNIIDNPYFGSDDTEEKK